MPFTNTLLEYRMDYPNTAECPTLSQGGWLALLLERRQHRLARLACRQVRRQKRRQTIRAGLGTLWAKLRGTVFGHANPVFARVPRGV